MAGPTGIEPATPGLKVRCSILTELRAHAFVGEIEDKTGLFIPTDLVLYSLLITPNHSQGVSQRVLFINSLVI